MNSYDGLQLLADYIIARRLAEAEHERLVNQARCSQTTARSGRSVTLTAAWLRIIRRAQRTAHSAMEAAA
jgi:hypothetical protein